MSSDLLFQYSVIKRPTQAEAEKGARSVVLVPPGEWILAKDEAEVRMIATRKIPEEEMQFADRLEVAVRPF